MDRARANDNPTTETTAFAEINQGHSQDLFDLYGETDFDSGQKTRF